MRQFAWVVLGVCCSASLGAQEVKVFTPSRQGDAPVFVNGQVVRVDRAAGTITVRNDGGQRVLHVDRQALATLGNVRSGSSVILGLRVTGTGANERSTVTEIRPSGGVSLSSNRVSANASMVSSGARSIGTAQVVSTNRSARRLTVVDSTGATRVLNVRGEAVNRLGTLRPGDSVSLGVAAPLAPGTPAGTVTTIDMTSSSAATSSNTFTNDSLPQAPGLPASPDDGISRNPAATGVQPAPQAQPVPGVQGPTGIQPVPGAQPLPGTGVTGQTAANPGLVPQPVPGASGQTSNNAGATGGVAPGARGTGAATAGVGGTAPTGTGSSGGGSPLLGPSVPQLGGVAVGGINSQIPSIPPNPGTVNAPVLPLPSVMPQTNPPRTPAEVARVREMASHDFDMAAAVLAVRAAEVDRAWAAYRGACVTSTLPVNNRGREWFGVVDGSLIAPTEDVCEASYNEVARLAQGLEAALDSARDTARRADVLPGRMREALERYNLDL